MKKLYLLAAVLAAALFALNACGSKNPAGPAIPVDSPTNTTTSDVSPTITETHTISPTVTDSPTIFVPPSVTETYTITPTATVSPTFTITQTETPFIIDDFNDNDLYNNINPPANQWDSFVNTPDAYSNTYTVSSLILTSGFYSYGLQIQAVSYADNPDGSGNYFTYYGITTTVRFSPASGIDFTLYRHLIFHIKAYIWNLATATFTYKYKVKLFDDSGRYVEQELTGLTVDNQAVYNHVSLEVSSFMPPAGALYSVSDVQSNVTVIRWEHSTFSVIAQDKCESFMNLDDIVLEK
jgi:predicted small lipoprotein YifL